MFVFSRPRRLRAERANAAALDDRVSALQRALESCRALSRRARRALALAIIALVISVVAVIVTNRSAVYRSLAGLVSDVSVTEPARGTEAAYDLYAAGDLEAALRVSKPLAEDGDARAQSLVGLILRTGGSVPKNYDEALKWFRRAADQGDNVAQFELGFMYSTGRGVPQDFSEGLKWYRRAADGGNPQAQFNLGVINYNGKGVPQSNVRAHMWFNLAAANFPSSDSRNREIAANVRDVVAMKMNREEVAEAQKLARDWRERQSTAEPNK